MAVTNEASHLGSSEISIDDLDVASAERMLRRKRLLFLYKVSVPVFVVSCVQAISLQLHFTLVLHATTFTCFFFSLRTFFRTENITKASWQYLVGFSVLVGLSTLVDHQMRSSVIWLLPLIPVIAAHLLGSRAAVFVAIGTSLVVVGTWLSSLFFTIAPEHHFNLFDKLVLHQFSLLVASGLGLSALRTATRQIRVIRKHEDELSEAQLAIEDTRRAKSLFLANMSHEIRTPLNGILGLTRLLSDKATGHADKEAIDIARTCGEQLMHLLNGVLDLSKMEAGKFRLRGDRIEILDLAQELEVSFASRFQKRGMNLLWQCHLERDLVLADRNCILRALSVFLDNALEHSGANLVEVCVSARRSDDAEKLEVDWSIRDNGMGMPQSVLDKALRISSKDVVSVDERYQGAGLGFALGVRILDLMGCHVSMESERGRGLFVRIRMPLAMCTQDDDVAARGTVEIRPALRLLLVDDNKINRLVASRTLALLECEVHEAQDGSQAVEMAQRQAFDLILMDLHMPEMDGLQATREIRAGEGPNKDTPIVALTAGDFEDGAEERQAAGMNDFLRKPIEETALKRVLGALCQAA